VKKKPGLVAPKRIPSKNPFEASEVYMNFRCDWGVYPKGSNSSICYCTDKLRATMVATALTFWWSSADGQRWLSRNFKMVRKSK